MPLSDYINIRPAPEATGGYNSGLGVTAEEMEAANRAFDFQTAANSWPAQVGVQPGVDLNAAAAALAANDRINFGNSGLPSNIFQGPISGLGLSTLPANAIYNLAAYGMSALGNMGYNQVPFSGLPTSGNVTANMSLGGLGQSGDLSGANVDISSLLASQGAGGLGILGLNPYTPGMSDFDRASIDYLVQNALSQQQAAQRAAAASAQSQTNIFPTDTSGGALGMGPFLVSEGSLNTPTGQPSFAGLGGIDLSGVGGGGMGPTALPAVRVNETNLNPTETTLPNVGVTSNVPTIGNVGETPSSGVSTLPSVNVTDTRTSAPQSASQYLINQYKARGLDQPTQLPPVTVTPGVTDPSVSPTIPSNQVVNVPNLGITGMGPFRPTPSTSTSSSTATTTQTVATTTTALPTITDLGFNVPGLGDLVPAAITPGTSGGRNFAAELAASRAALANEQGNLMNMYGGIYQNLLGQTAIPEAAQRSMEQARLDQAKLQRVQSGQLAAEDIRQAQQAAREAYGARGQVMGQPAIGAEILNREAIRQQREDQARAGYQASMGNVFNAANLQTGNIFQPIGSLVSQTFNPLGAYPQDVYSSNFNAAQAQQIAAMNNAAAIEAAKYGAQAQRQAATTAGIFNLGSRLLPGLFG